MDKLQTVYLNCPGSQSMMGFLKLKYLTKVSFVGAFHVKPSDTDCSSQENSLCRYAYNLAYNSLHNHRPIQYIYVQLCMYTPKYAFHWSRYVDIHYYKGIDIRRVRFDGGS